MMWSSTTFTTCPFIDSKRWNMSLSWKTCNWTVYSKTGPQHTYQEIMYNNGPTVIAKQKRTKNTFSGGTTTSASSLFCSSPFVILVSPILLFVVIITPLLSSSSFSSRSSSLTTVSGQQPNFKGTWFSHAKVLVVDFIYSDAPTQIWST